MGGLLNFLFGIEETDEEEQPEIEDEDLPHAPDLIDPIEGFEELNDRINENQTVGMEDGLDIGEDDNDENEEV